jgi:hypothetical protein
MSYGAIAVISLRNMRLIFPHPQEPKIFLARRTLRLLNHRAKLNHNIIPVFPNEHFLFRSLAILVAFHRGTFHSSAPAPAQAVF